MLVASLVLNVAVLLPVCVGLIAHAEWARACYGEDSPARRILLAVYLAIGVGSAALLFTRPPAATATLLLLQVLYKLATPLTVGTLANPVVLSNLGIAAFHSLTLLVVWRSGGLDSPAG